jgi:hypothetical protein
LASPALTGVPTAPTAASNTNTTQIATTAYVQNEISELIDAAPGALDTLNELAAAMGDDPNFATTVTNSLATKLPLAGGTMTGAIAMGTNKITGAGDPTSAQDVATKNYVDTTVIAPTNLTGPITSVGNVTSVASQTGTGSKFVMDNTPTLITPVLGVATATSINGTTIPSSKTLVATDSTTYVVPSQSGNTGKFLTTDGSVSSWASVDALPSQTGNAGEFLTTDGTTASWAVVAGSLAQPTEPSSPTDGQIWVDTDGTALINQLLRWSESPANGTTTLSGNDDNGLPLTYSVGYEQVFQNGALLARGSDYTATNGTSISLTNASVTGDIFEVFAAQPVAISDVYTQSQVNAAFIPDSVLDAKGDILTATGNDTPARLAVGANGDTLVADSSTSTGLRYTAGNPIANPTLNSAMQLWQRGTSFTITTPVYSADRWQVGRGANVAGSTVTRQLTNDTTNLPNIQYCLRFARDSGNTATNPLYLAQSFESVNSIPFAGKTVTMSFYARAGANYSATSNVLSARLLSGTGTDQNLLTNGYTGSTSVIGQNATLTTTWQRFTYTASIASTATEIGLFFESNPTGTAGAADFFEITGLQIDVGSVALPFRTNGGTIQGELAACQRYYYRQGGKSDNQILASGFGYNSTTTYFFLTPPVTMRIEPSTLEYASLANWDGVTTGAITNLTIDSQLSSPNTLFLAATMSGGGGTQYRPQALFTNNTLNGYLAVSAEL